MLKVDINIEEKVSSFLLTITKEIYQYIFKSKYTNFESKYASLIPLNTFSLSTITHKFYMGKPLFSKVVYALWVSLIIVEDRTVNIGCYIYVIRSLVDSCLIGYHIPKKFW